MKKCPAIGTRVRYPGGLTIGPCVGVVVHIFKTYDWDFDGDDEPIMGSQRLRPQSEWRVSMKVDKVPEKWCYSGTNRFAPSVAEIKRE